MKGVGSNRPVVSLRTEVTTTDGIRMNKLAGREPREGEVLLQPLLVHVVREYEARFVVLRGRAAGAHGVRER